MNNKFKHRITEEMIQGFHYNSSDFLDNDPTLLVVLKPEIYDFISDCRYHIKLIKQSYGREIDIVRGDAGVEFIMEPLHNIFLNSVGIYVHFENINDFTNFKIKYG